MARRLSISSEFHLRIRRRSTLDYIQNLFDSKEYDSVNEILNTALEKGLPAMIENAEAVIPDNIAKTVADRVIEELSPLTDSLLLNMKKVTVLQTVQEAMLGSLIQEFEFFLKTKGITLDPKLLDEFRFSIPDRFEKDKQELIDRLFNSIQGSDDDE